jgi:hypothetical protein
MLAHQLPSLPPYESFWDELPAFFDWLAGGIAPIVPARYATSQGEVVLRQRDLRLPVPGPSQSVIEIIRFAAGNHLLVELDDQGSTRHIEPYSLRQTQDGNIVLHAWNTEKNEHRSYRVDRIQGARVTNQTFLPRYALELGPQGPLIVQQAASRPRPFVPRAPSASQGWASGTASRRGTSHGKPVHIYQCPLCNKKFRRESYDSHLNPHKNEWGGPCQGTTGFYVETRF